MEPETLIADCTKARLAWYSKSNPSDIKYGAWVAPDIAKAWADYGNKEHNGFVHFIEYKVEKGTKNG